MITIAKPPNRPDPSRPRATPAGSAPRWAPAWPSAAWKGPCRCLHGSQGCATYIRRYMISHFREPLDIASSNFSEETAIFGGRENLRTGLENVVRQYAPRLIGIATTCLAETIGDDVAMYLREIAAEGRRSTAPKWSTSPRPATRQPRGGLPRDRAGAGRGAGRGRPAPRGRQRDRADRLARRPAAPQDDLSATSAWSPSCCPITPTPWTARPGPSTSAIPPGGTPMEAIRRMGGARATIEFGSAWHDGPTAGKLPGRAVRRAPPSRCRCRWG